MELSQSVQKGLQALADPSAFDRTSFQVLVDVSFRSLLSSQGDPTVLGEPQPPSRRRRHCCLCLLYDFRFSPVWIGYVKCCLDVFWVVLRCCVLRVARNRFLRVYVQILNEARWTRQTPISRAKAMLAAPQPLCAACFTFTSSSHTITRPLGTPFVI